MTRETGTAVAAAIALTEAGADNLYAWGEGCLGWRLLEQEGLQLRQELMQPGTSETPHLHRRARQVFYVLEGEMTLRMPEGTLRARPRQAIHVPPGRPHWVRNDGAGDLVFVLVSSPSTAGDRIEVETDGWPPLTSCDANERDDR